MKIDSNPRKGVLRVMPNLPLQLLANISLIKCTSIVLLVQRNLIQMTIKVIAFDSLERECNLRRKKVEPTVLRAYMFGLGYKCEVVINHSHIYANVMSRTIATLHTILLLDIFLHFQSRG